MIKRQYMKKLIVLMLATVFAAFTMSVSADAQDKGDKTYNLQRAYEVLRDSDYDQALLLVKEQLRITPENAEAHLLMGRIYSSMREYGKALTAFNSAMKYNKPKKTGINASSLYWWKADVYERMGEHEASAQHYHKALLLAGKDAPDNVQEISFEYAQVLYNLDALEAADLVYRLMLKADETDVAAMAGLSRNMIDRGEYDQAIDILDRAQRYRPGYSEIYRFRMQAYDKLGKTDKAIDDALSYVDNNEKYRTSLIMPVLTKRKNYSVASIKSMIKNGKNSEGFRALLIELYEECEDYENALKEYDNWENDFGKSDYIYGRKAVLYSGLNMHDVALEMMDKALEMETDYSNLVMKAGLLIGANRYQEALEFYTKAIDMEPAVAYTYVRRAVCYEYMGEDAKALEDFDMALDLDAEYSPACFKRGDLHLRNGREDLAKADFEHVIQIDTVAVNGSYAHYAFALLGRHDEAKQWEEKIIESEPYSSNHIYDKCCLYARMGYADEAMAILAKALEMGFCDLDHISRDRDVDSLRERDDFKELMAECKAKLDARVAKIAAQTQEEESESSLIEVPITRHPGGTFEVACEVNGLPLNMIFDTGASDVSISKVEADFMFKNNYLGREDIMGKQYYQTADGGISEGTVITLKEVKIGDAVLHNVNASVAKSQKAPLLLGQSVLEKFGTFTVDNINSKLIIKP